MKIGCPCGATISDSTDRLTYKARYVADQDMELFTNDLEMLLDRLMLSLDNQKGWQTSNETAPLEARQNLEDVAKNLLSNTISKYLSRTLYQCHDCGRLLIDRNKEWVPSYLPDDREKSLGVFWSSLEEQFPAAVVAGWNPRNSKGDIWWEQSGQLEGGFEQYTDFEKLKIRYFEVIAMLNSEGRLGSAWLHEDQITIHKWPEVVANKF